MSKIQGMGSLSYLLLKEKGPYMFLILLSGAFLLVRSNLSSLQQAPLVTYHFQTANLAEASKAEYSITAEIQNRTFDKTFKDFEVVVKFPSLDENLENRLSGAPYIYDANVIAKAPASPRGTYSTSPGKLVRFTLPEFHPQTTYHLKTWFRGQMPADMDMKMYLAGSDQSVLLQSYDRLSHGRTWFMSNFDFLFLCFLFAFGALYLLLFSQLGHKLYPPNEASTSPPDPTAPDHADSGAA